MKIVKEIFNSSDYKKIITEKIEGNDDLLNEVLREALKQALETRKFEIELYWKRATYFWAFIASSFAAYFVIINSNNLDDFKPLTIAVSMIGLLFSLSWYFVNRGSKYWQVNWEKHISMLEDEIFGSLFKIVYNPNKTKFWKLANEYPFSVSKINQILSLFVFLIWVFILIYSIDFTFSFDLFEQYTFFINMLYFSFVFIFAIWQLIKNSKSSISKINKTESENEPVLLKIIDK